MKKNEILKNSLVFQQGIAYEIQLDINSQILCRTIQMTFPHTRRSLHEIDDHHRVDRSFLVSHAGNGAS
jgi:hypothetical protein